MMTEDGSQQEDPAGFLFQFAIDEARQAELEAALDAQAAARSGSLDYLHALPHFGDQLPLPVNSPEALAALPEPQLKLAYHLQFLSQMYTERPTAPVLAPSPATAVPLLGPLWSRVRAQMHQLILFYVGRSDAHQAEINNHLLQIVAQLSETVSRQNEELARLRSERSETGERQTGDRDRDGR